MDLVICELNLFDFYIAKKQSHDTIAMQSFIIKSATEQVLADGCWMQFV